MLLSLFRVRIPAGEHQTQEYTVILYRAEGRPFAVEHRIAVAGCNRCRFGHEPSHGHVGVRTVPPDIAGRAVERTQARVAPRDVERQARTQRTEPFGADLIHFRAGADAARLQEPADTVSEVADAVALLPDPAQTPGGHAIAHAILFDIAFLDAQHQVRPGDLRP